MKLFLFCSLPVAFMFASIAHLGAQPKQGSAEANTRIQQYLDRINGSGTPGKKPVDKEAKVQALRDAVIASGAVVRYISHKEEQTPDEWEYVRIYVNASPAKAAPLLKGLDEAKMRKFIQRVEVQAWVTAETAYQKGK